MATIQGTDKHSVNSDELVKPDCSGLIMSSLCDSSLCLALSIDFGFSWQMFHIAAISNFWAFLLHLWLPSHSYIQTLSSLELHLGNITANRLTVQSLP